MQAHREGLWSALHPASGTRFFWVSLGGGLLPTSTPGVMVCSAPPHTHPPAGPQQQVAAAGGLRPILVGVGGWCTHTHTTTADLCGTSICAIASSVAPAGPCPKPRQARRPHALACGRTCTGSGSGMQMHIPAWHVSRLTGEACIQYTPTPHALPSACTAAHVQHSTPPVQRLPRPCSSPCPPHHFAPPLSSPLAPFAPPRPSFHTLPRVSGAALMSCPGDVGPGAMRHGSVHGSHTGRSLLTGDSRCPAGERGRVTAFLLARRRARQKWWVPSVSSRPTHAPELWTTVTLPDRDGMVGSTARMTAVVVA